MSQPPIGSAGEAYNPYGNDPSIGSFGQVPPQGWGRTPNMNPPMGSAGETTPHYTNDPSIGTAGMIPGHPGRIFPNAPPPGSAGVAPGPENSQWNPHVGTANEGEEQKHGFLYNMFHKH